MSLSDKNDFIIVTRKALVQEVQVAGNVQPAQSVDLSFEKTGTVTVLFVDIGQKVETGQLLAQLDIQDAKKEIRDAEIVLESAQLVLEKIILEQL